MSRLRPTQDSRTRYDTETGAVRSFFGIDLVEGEVERELTAARKTTEEETNDFLNSNKDLFKLENITLEKADTREGSATQSVKYEQKHQGIPVYGAQLVVGLRKQDGRITSAVNKVDYEIPDTLGLDSVHVNAEEVIESLHERFDGLFSTLEMGTPKLYVYRHVAAETVEPPYGSPPIRDEMLGLGTGAEGEVYLAWQVLMDTREPGGNWELLVDATNGDLVTVKDRRFYATRKGYVFWPDPISSSQNDNLTWSTSESTLNAERREVDLENLDAPVNNKYKLNGSWVKNVEKESPTLAPPESTGHFQYGAKDRKFLNVMVYYYIDHLVRYLRGFGIPTYNNAVSGPIDVDPQGVSSADNSHFVPSGPYIAFGEGGVPDASDPAVIVHEYGHALHHFMLGNHSNSSYEEGFNDFLAACWLDRFNDNQFQREKVFPWDNNKSINWGPKRRVDLSERFDDPGFSGYGFYFKGNVLATALWDIYLNLGGNSTNGDERSAAADAIIHTYLEMLVTVQGNQPPEDLANGLINADNALTGGRYRAVIRDAFWRRGLWIGINFNLLSLRGIAAKCLNKIPPLSVRNDIYGSASPQDRSLKEQLRHILSSC